MVSYRFYRLLTGKIFGLKIFLLAFAATCGYYYGCQQVKIKSFTESVIDIYEQPSSPSPYVLLDMANFHFVHNPKEICTQRFQKGKINTILLVIHSARAHFRSRQIVRKTYGSVTTFRGWYVQVVFTVGSGTENEMIEDLLRNEIMKFGDIIMGNFEDTFRNLSYKHLMGYKWAIEFCPQANYYIKADDDVILNIFHAIDFLSSNKSKTMYKDYYCYVFAETPPVRQNSQWKVTLEEYSKNMYPNYCGFAAYVVGITTVRRIMSVSSMDKYFFIDSVFVSGLLRELVNQKEPRSTNKINLINSEGYFMEGDVQKLRDVIRKKEVLTIIEEARSPNVSCEIWRSVLELHGYSKVYVSTCSSLL